MEACWNCKGEGCMICEDRHDDWTEQEYRAVQKELEEETDDTMSAIIGRDEDNCFHLYINSAWEESSMRFEDVKRSAEEAGFTVEYEADEHGIPLRAPVLTYVGSDIE